MRSIITLVLSIFIAFPANINQDIESLNLSSNNYILYSIDSDEVLADKNKDKHLSFASINKLLNLITALDYISEKDLDKEVVISEDVINDVVPGSSVAGFKAGDKVTMRDILYGVVLPSGADASLQLSYTLFNDTNAIVKKMNEKAQKIGMKNTKIVNPYGLDDPNQYSTLEDILTLLKYALKNDIFYDIYTSRNYQIESLNITLQNRILAQSDWHNADYIMGAKSGHTNNAKRALTSFARKNDTSYIFISTQAEGDAINNQALNDAVKVYSYMFDNYSKKSIVGDSIVDYNYDEKGKTVIVNNEIDLSQIDFITESNKSKYLYKDEVIYEYDLDYNIFDKVIRYVISLIILILVLLLTLRIIIKNRKRKEAVTK